MAMVIASCWPAITLSIAGILPILHAAFLVILYLLARLLVGRWNKWVGKLIFASATLILAINILVYQTTGLHLNPFVLSVMLQPGISNELGIPATAVYSAILALIIISIVAARRLKEPSFILYGRHLLLAATLSGFSAQLLYAFLYFQGAAEVEKIRRDLPFFVAPHPYQSEKLLGTFLNKKTNNPFALSREKLKKRAASNLPTNPIVSPKNILMIIADSLRSLDIKDDPTLTPNLMKWAENNSFSLDHYSVSNCTHFSFYSMFTGSLPTEFGADRRGETIQGLLPFLASSGYKLSTSEAASLDWYDTASMLFPPETRRYISAKGTPIKRDTDVTQNSIDVLRKHQKSQEPFFHLSYYFGSHFPYDDTFGFEGETNHQKYLRTLKAFDAEMSELMGWLEDSGLLEDTLVIITSDHGEEFESTGRTGHASRLSDEQLKVPFLLIDGAAKTQTPNANPKLTLKSHLDLAPYLISTLTGTPFSTPQATILAGCGYDYPSSFALIDNDLRTDFSHKDGYLTPIPAPDGSQPTKAKQLQVAASLIALIKKGTQRHPSN